MISLGSGTIGDITNANERGRALAIFQMGPLAGRSMYLMMMCDGRR